MQLIQKASAAITHEIQIFWCGYVKTLRSTERMYLAGHLSQAVMNAAAVANVKYKVAGKILSRIMHCTARECG